MANIVVNPGFEAGSTGWIFDGFSVFNNPRFAHSGNNSAATGCVSHRCVSTQGSGAYISQTLGTASNVGYNLSFWVGENDEPTSEFSVFWNGQLIADVLNPANNTLPHPPQGGMIQFSYNNLLATGAFTVLEVHERQDQSIIFFDDFVVNAAGNAVPEPGTLGLVSLAIFGVAAARRKSINSKSGAA